MLAAIRLTVTVQINDMPPDTVDLRTAVTTVDEGMAWLSDQFRELAEAAPSV